MRAKLIYVDALSKRNRLVDFAHFMKSQCFVSDQSRSTTGAKCVTNQEKEHDDRQ